MDSATERGAIVITDRKSTRLNSSHSQIPYAVFCLKKKTNSTTRLARLVLRLTYVIRQLRISGLALLILALLQRICLMSSLMLLLVWLIFFMVLIKLLPILGTISGKTVKLMVLALICLGNNRQD